jgi:signal transduction histidine kinase
MVTFRLPRHALLASAIATVTAGAIFFVSEGSFRESMQTLDALAAVGAVRTGIQNLERDIVDAETGQRGYLLTGRPEYKAPYDRAVKDIDVSFQGLTQYYAGDPASADLVRRLRKLIDSRMSELALTIHLLDEGKGKETTEIVLSNIGKEQMDGVRELSAELLRREASNLEAHRNELNRTLVLSRFGVAVLSGAGLLALFMYLLQTSALDRQRREQQVLIQCERDRLKDEVVHQTAQLIDLMQHLQTAREDERSKLARDLHDELGALLTSAKLDSARIRSRLHRSVEEAAECLDHLVGTLNKIVAMKRQIIEDLRPSTLDNLGLVPTLEALAGEFATQSGVRVECSLAPVKLTDSTNLVIYRLVQEAITNIAKYAKASHVWLSLALADGCVRVSIRDDGVGFDPNANLKSGHGLLGMRYRVEAEGGVLGVDSAPGKGTAIKMTLRSPVLSQA